MSSSASLPASVVQLSKNEDRNQSLDALTMAFCADPVLRFCYPDPKSYLTHFPRFAAAFGGKAFSSGSAFHIGNYVGSALWLPPDIYPSDEEVFGHFEKSVEPSKVKTVFSVLEQMAKYHPDEPHWYLALIGVDFGHQGAGYGTLLMGAMTERIDVEGRLAYLESTNPKNLTLYERFGFELVGRIDSDIAPPLFPMVRRPQKIH